MREALLHAGHEQQPSEGVVVDDRHGEHHPGQHQRDQRARPLADREADGLRAAGGAVRPSGLDHHHVAPGRPEVRGHHDDAPPEQERPDRLLPTRDLDPHVQGRLDPEEGEDREREERQVRGESERELLSLEGIPSGRERGGGRVPFQEPDDAREADQEDHRDVRPELDVHVVLRDPHPEVRHRGTEPKDREDDESELPVLREDRARLAVAREEAGELLEEVGHEDPDEDQRDRAGPPGDEPGEEAPERAQDLVGPHVQGSLLREHPAELRGDEPTGDQEGREGQDPEEEDRRPGGLHSRRVVDEQDDRDEDHDEVERSERPRHQHGRDLLRDHRLFVGPACHAAPPPKVEAPVERAFPTS